jgi:hypothetical protein
MNFWTSKTYLIMVGIALALIAFGLFCNPAAAVPE